MEPEHPQIAAQRRTAREQGREAGVAGKHRSVHGAWRSYEAEWLAGYDEGARERVEGPGKM